MAAFFRIKKSNETTANTLMSNTTNFPISEGSLYFTKDHFLIYDYKENDTAKRAVINAAQADRALTADDVSDASTFFHKYLDETPATQITTINLGSMPTFKDVQVAQISNWSPGTAIDYNDINIKTITDKRDQGHEYSDGVLNIIEAYVSYNTVTASNITDPGSQPTLSYSETTVSKNDEVGSLPTLQYTNKDVLKYKTNS